MAEMTEEQMQEALKHDAAAKGIDAVLPDTAAAPEIFSSPEAARVFSSQLETRNALLAKDLVTGFMQTAREFVALSLMTGRPKIGKDKEGKNVTHYDPPKPELSIKWMEAATRAMELARSADAIGDRAIFRKEDVAK